MIHDDFWEHIPLSQEIIESIEFRKLKSITPTSNILIFAGAGMSQESGLPVFRSKEGLVKSNYSQKELIDLFDSHTPHEGYKILLDFCKDRKYYVFTSNIDGYFERAGFNKDKIIEIHGNIHDVQCEVCDRNIERYNEENGEKCDLCFNNLIANVFTGGFYNWKYKTSEIEKKMENDIKYGEWVIIEIGAGIHLPVIRDYSEILVEDKNFKLIRINPTDWQIPSDILSKNTIRIPYGAIQGLKIITA